MVPVEILRLAGSYLEIGSRFVVLWRAFASAPEEAGAPQREELLKCSAAADAAAATRGALLALTEAVGSLRTNCPPLREWCSLAGVGSAEAGHRWELVLAVLLGAVLGGVSVAVGAVLYLRLLGSSAASGGSGSAASSTRPSSSTDYFVAKQGFDAPRADGSPRQLARLGLGEDEQRIVTPKARRHDVARPPRSPGSRQV